MQEFTWCVDSGASLSTDVRANRTQFGDGYAQLSSTGINNTVQSGSLTMTGYSSAVNAAYEFLIARRGVQPFLLMLDAKKAYVTEGAITREHVGADVWRLSFTVKQFYG